MLCFLCSVWLWLYIMQIYLVAQSFIAISFLTDLKNVNLRSDQSWASQAIVHCAKKL